MTAAWTDDVPWVHVRHATEADAPAIAAIHIEGWRAAYRGLVPDAILDGRSLPEATERRANALRDRSPDDPNRTWVVTAGGEIRGFATTCPGRDGSAPPPDGAGEVAAIYLDPGSVGIGIGRTLFDHAVRDLVERGFDPLVVWVFEANARARRFYEAAGFAPDGARFDIDFDGTIVPEVRYRRAAHKQRP